jgi:tRNA/tmRNA/rRNA uracil-C5-methylase (TrmA/RlmC/RlmD family)
VLVRALGQTEDDIVVDPGCGTGQLTLPLAGRVRGVAGVDAEDSDPARCCTFAAVVSQ